MSRCTWAFRSWDRNFGDFRDHVAAVAAVAFSTGTLGLPCRASPGGKRAHRPEKKRHMNTIVIRPLVVDDWTAVQAIYSDGIGTGHATFEETPPSWTTFDAGKLTHSRLVAVDNTGTIFGWVAASAVSSRSVYVGVVEHSVYVADTARGRGIGRALLKAFIASAEANGVWKSSRACSRKTPPA